jgi:hypothetical protein
VETREEPSFVLRAGISNLIPYELAENTAPDNIGASLIGEDNAYGRRR